jgi:hypothetical protein
VFSFSADANRSPKPAQQTNSKQKIVLVFLPILIPNEGIANGRFAANSGHYFASQ